MALQTDYPTVLHWDEHLALVPPYRLGLELHLAKMRELATRSVLRTAPK